MLRNWGIRWKVLAVLALPVLVLAVVSGTLAVAALREAAQARRTGALFTSGDTFGRVTSSLQAERLATVRLLSGDAAARADLEVARARTDADVAALNVALVTSGVAGVSAEAAAAVDRSRQSHTRLQAVRSGVDAGTTAVALADEIYSGVVRTDVDLPARIADGLADRTLAQPLTASSLLGRVAEAASREQLAGLAMTTSGVAGTADQRDLAVAALDLRRALEDFRAAASSVQITALTQALTEGRVTENDVARLRDALQLAGTSSPVTVGADEWTATTAQRAEQLRQVGHLVTAQASAQAEQAVTDARARAAVVLGGAVVLVGLSVLLALVLSRRITAPLRRLTDDVTRMATGMPELVEKVAGGADVPEPDETAPTGRDEAAALAAAFRSVNATTLHVAREQARLRAAVADMFVTVARRNQVLLSRQLAFIDTLERTEEDPDSLENLFRLDHLATRMRRNAESLLVLAGADGGRRRREPMPLSDVLRTAVSEVEHFERVRLAATVDPPVVAHLALPAAHLVAELVENATVFSDPGAPVLVETAVTPDGVQVRVRDSGLGLSAAELTDANTRLASPHLSDVVGSQRLGFFVVARLAARIGANVRLEAAPGGGTVARVDLSPVVFVPGSVEAVDVPAALEAPDAVDDVPVADVPAEGGRLVLDLESGTREVVPVDAAEAVEPVEAGHEDEHDDEDDEHDDEDDAGAEPQRLVAPEGTPAVLAAVDPFAGPLPDTFADADTLAPADPVPHGEQDDLFADPTAAAADVTADVAADDAADVTADDHLAVPVDDPLFGPLVGAPPAPPALPGPPPLPLTALPEPLLAQAPPPALPGAAPLPPPLPEPAPAPVAEPVAAVAEPVVERVVEPVVEPVEPIAAPAPQPATAIAPAIAPATAPAAVQAPEPADERAHEPAPQQPGLSVPVGATTIDILPQQGHRGGLLRGRRAKQSPPSGRRAAAPPVPPEPATSAGAARVATSAEPPRRRALRNGIGWLPPESPGLFDGTDRAQPETHSPDEERLRHAIASEALTELSRLSSYSPTTVSPAPASSLTRRTPQPAPEEAAPVPAPVASAPVAPLFGRQAPERFGRPSEPFPGSLGDHDEHHDLHGDHAADHHEGSWAAPGAAPAGLPTRVPSSAAPAPAVLPPRPRSADGVRSTLSGFTDGVRRARRVAVGEPDA